MLILTCKFIHHTSLVSMAIRDWFIHKEMRNIDKQANEYDDSNAYQCTTLTTHRLYKKAKIDMMGTYVILNMI